MRIDTSQLRQQSKEISARLLQLESEAHQLAQQTFNLGSPKQIGES